MKKLVSILQIYALVAGMCAPALGSTGRILEANVIRNFAPQKNYIKFGTFEENNTNGWTLCNTTLTSGLPTGTITNTASSFNALSTTSSSPLAGSYSLSVSSPGATTAGQGFCSSTFTIDAEDSTNSPKVQYITASYSGTSNMNFSGTSSNTWAVYIYDVTNSAWIQPQGVYNFTGDGKLVATFQPSKSSAQYKLVLLNVNASSGAISMKWDSFVVGPQAVQKGPAVGDWQSFTMTIGATTTPPTKGTIAVDSAQWRRVGDSEEIRYDFRQTAAGSAGSGVYLFPLAGGCTIDSSKIGGFDTSASSEARYNVGSAQVSNSSDGVSSTSRYGVVVPYNSTNLSIAQLSGSTDVFSQVSSSNFPLSGTNVVYSFTAKVPCSGWSSNSVQSSDTDTRVIAASASGTPSAPTANNPVIFGTVDYDTHAAYSTSTGKYTVPVSGYYDVSVYLNADPQAAYDVYVNGSSRKVIGVTAPTSGRLSATVTVKVSTNDLIHVGPESNASAFGASWIQIKRAPGPAVVTATDIVAAAITQAANVTATLNSVIIFPSVLFDTHNAYNSSTGLYSCPVSGIYRVSTSGLNFNASAPTIYVNLNGAYYGTVGIATGSGAGGGTLLVKCNLGDTISLYPSTSDTLVYSAPSGHGGSRAIVTFERLKQ